MQAQVLVTQQIPAEGLDLLRQEAGVKLEVNPMPGAIWTPEDLLRRVPGHEYVLCLLTDQMDAATLEAGARGTPALRLVANMAVGYNNIDLEAARRLGVLVTNTPGVLTEATADFTWALMLAATRRIPEADRFTRAGRFMPAESRCRRKRSGNSTRRMSRWRTCCAGRIFFRCMFRPRQRPITCSMPARWR
jgi:glyoxylate reductase